MTDQAFLNRRLIEGLLADDRRLIDRYNRSAVFKAAVDSLASMLPSMVRGLADQADIEQERHDALLELISRGPGNPLLGPGFRP